MFGNNSFAKIKEVEDKGTYSLCKITISKKDRRKDKYETVFVGKVKFVGNAHLQRPMDGQRIKILSCGTQNCYVDGADKLKFLDPPTYTIFEYELQEEGDSRATSEKPHLIAMDDDAEIPF